MIEKIKRQRARIALAAYAYEVQDESFMTDSEYDLLSICVEKTKHIETGNTVLDKFFREQFSPDTGMWIRHHPDFLNNKIPALYQYLQRISP